MSALRAALVLAAAAATLLFTTTISMDDFGRFATLLALGLAALALLEEGAPRRVLLQAGLVVLAVSTRHLAGIAMGTQGLALLVTRAAVAPAALMLVALALVGTAAGSLDLAAVGAAGGAGTTAVTAGTVLLVLALVLDVVVVTRSALASPRSPIPSGAFTSAAALLAAGASLTRVLAWLPDLAPLLEALLAAGAIGALAYGAALTVLAERVRSVVAGIALAQGGLAGLALLGGVHGRPAVLLQLATSCVALVLLGLGLARRGSGEPLTLEALSRAPAPLSARALAATGVLAALALPPGPGLVARLATASALLGRGRIAIFLAALGLTLVLAAGAARLLVASLAGPRAPRPRAPLAELLVFAAIVAFVLAFGLVPGPLFDAASRGAAGLF